MATKEQVLAALAGVRSPDGAALPQTGKLSDVVVSDGDRFRLDYDRPESVGKVREFWGNVQQIVKAYLWSRAMGAEGIKEAADLSVLGADVVGFHTALYRDNFLRACDRLLPNVTVQGHGIRLPDGRAAGNDPRLGDDLHAAVGMAHGQVLADEQRRPLGHDLDGHG